MRFDNRRIARVRGFFIRKQRVECGIWGILRDVTTLIAFFLRHRRRRRYPFLLNIPVCIVQLTFTKAFSVMLVFRYRCSQVCVQSGQLSEKFLILFGCIGMHCLAMLSQIVKTRERLLAVTLERPLSGMLADMSGKVLASGENHPTVTKALALEYSRAIARCTQCGLSSSFTCSSRTRSLGLGHGGRLESRGAQELGQPRALSVRS